jgi:hypothetical protein
LVTKAAANIMPKKTAVPPAAAAVHPIGLEASIMHPQTAADCCCAGCEL